MRRGSPPPQIFVLLVWVLTAGIVLSWYMILAPYVWHNHGTAALAGHALVSHWLLVNIVFHYYKGMGSGAGAVW